MKEWQLCNDLCKRASYKHIQATYHDIDTLTRSASRAAYGVACVFLSNAVIEVYRSGGGWMKRHLKRPRDTTAHLRLLSRTIQYTMGIMWHDESQVSHAVISPPTVPQPTLNHIAMASTHHHIPNTPARGLKNAIAFEVYTCSSCRLLKSFLPFPVNIGYQTQTRSIISRHTFTFSYTLQWD